MPTAYLRTPHDHHFFAHILRRDTFAAAPDNLSDTRRCLFSLPHVDKAEGHKKNMHEAFVYGYLMTADEALNQIVNKGNIIGYTAKQLAEHSFCPDCYAPVHLKNTGSSLSTCFDHKDGTAKYCPSYDKALSAIYSKKRKRTDQEIHAAQTRGQNLRQQFLDDTNLPKVWNFWRMTVGEYSGCCYLNDIKPTPWYYLTDTRFDHLVRFADHRNLWEIDDATIERIAFICAASQIFNGHSYRIPEPKGKETPPIIEQQKWQIETHKDEISLARYSVLFEDNKIITFGNKHKSISTKSQTPNSSHFMWFYQFSQKISHLNIDDDLIWLDNIKPPSSQLMQAYSGDIEKLRSSTKDEFFASEEQAGALLRNVIEKERLLTNIVLEKLQYSHNESGNLVKISRESPLYLEKLNQYIENLSKNTMNSQHGFKP